MIPINKLFVFYLTVASFCNLLCWCYVKTATGTSLGDRTASAAGKKTAAPKKRKLGQC